MSRHRNIRKMNYDEECDIDEVYGRSVEDDYCISPNTAAEFMYDRTAQNFSFSHYLTGDNDDIPEEEAEAQKPEDGSQKPLLSRQLNELDQARLQSCLDEICNVVGDSIPTNIIKEAIITNNFDVEKSLDKVLSDNNEVGAMPQRVRRDRNKKESQKLPETAPALVLRETSLQANATINDKNVRTSTSPEPEARSEKPLVVVAQQEPTKPSNTIKENAKINVEAEYARERASSKDLINMVVIGHVDAGKSTLMGHLLFLVGAVSQKLMHKYQQESKKIGKTSFVYAWVLDETGEERNRGITMDVGQYKFETESKIVTLLDAPGHKDFIPNMITGAAQADVAILVVDATKGEFETGFESGGQTREHALLVRSLGVAQLVVVVNKLDTVGWSQERFDEIVKKIGHFLKQVGYKETDIDYVPCSGLTGSNLKDPPKEDAARWYRGRTLIQQIDNFKSPERPMGKPFRMSVGDIFKGQLSGFCVSGRIETGYVSSGDRVLVMPQGETAHVKGIAIDDLPVTSAFAGDQVTLSIANMDMANVTTGSLMCSISQPIRASSVIQARIVIFNIDVPITKGFPVVFHYQTLSEPAVVRKLISQLHKSTGEVIKSRPRCLTKNSSAIIELEINRPVCVELYKDFKELGRFMLRSKGSTIAAGLVTKIL